ncbi:uncharacterized protein [Littorina saxatilis]|uniref:uncharacterized protein n=1 Tax=Littorina saxatilis TaxID=31220 RepID=UPI0032E9A67F
MAGVPIPKQESGERLPLHEDVEGQDADMSLMHSARSSNDNNRNGYYSDPVFGGMNDNPYRDTTESDGSNIRHMPLSEVIPRPWRSCRQIEIASYISLVLFLLTGIFAVKYVRRGRMHQSKGLMGMAQRDLRLAVRLIYASVGLGLVLFLIIIPIAAS